MTGRPSGESGKELELTAYASFLTAGDWEESAPGQCYI